jgi:Protein of unknown function (DUF1214)
VRSQAMAKYGELLDLLGEAARVTLDESRGITSVDDVGEGLRNISHILQSALYAHQESDPERPVFTRIVSPTRSFTGDNPDAIYFEAPVAGGLEYVVRGNLAGAAYTSFTMEAGALDGRYATATAGIINDTNFDVDPDGWYEIRLGGPPAERNWLAVPAEGGRVTSRHYFEWPDPAAASQTLHVPVSIEAIPTAGPPSRWGDETVAAALQRVINHVKGKTLDAPRPAAVRAPFVSSTPNQFPDPVKPGNMAFAAFDAAYSLAPYHLGPDEALIITGRWPACRFANVCLWNRFSQMYNYPGRLVSRNRANTTLLADGSFRMILAHQDPGAPNWLDTEGRSSGTIFWRFFLPEGDIATPQAEVVDLSSFSRNADPA